MYETLMGKDPTEKDLAEARERLKEIDACVAAERADRCSP